MAKSRHRRIHIELNPPFDVQVGERRVRFVGANLLTRVVMVEYDVEPPIGQRHPPFGPAC